MGKGISKIILTNRHFHNFRGCSIYELTLLVTNIFKDFNWQMQLIYRGKKKVKKGIKKAFCTKWGGKHVKTIVDHFWDQTDRL